MTTPQFIDVGWSYRLTDGPTRLVLVSMAKSHENWPADDLLVLTGPKGQFGMMKTEHPDFKQYKTDVVELVKKYLDDRTIIVLPEFSGSLSIENDIKALLDNADKRCIVVGGSYYRTIHDPDEAEPRVQHVCPILIPNTPTYYQQKFVSAPVENPGFDTVERRTLLVFRHTGFGDFAVLICSDALDNNARNKCVAVLRHQIDLLVVPARNQDPHLPESLQTLANNERWSILYCNGGESHGSQIISPYRRISGKVPELVDHTASIDLRQFQKDVHSRPDDLHTCTERGRYFEPGPRHWPFRELRASGFSDYLRVVAIGSHFDDVWLGCSGTLMRLQECYNAQIRVVTLCNSYPSDYFGRYNLRGAALTRLYRDLDDLCRKLGFKHVSYEGEHALEDQSFAEERVNSYMKELADECCQTDLLFVPRQDDLHPDHMVTAKAAMLKFRGANVFEYEIKDFRRSPFNPNVLVDLSVRSNNPIEFAGMEPFTNESFAEKKAYVLENAFTMMNREDLPDTFKREHNLGRMIFRASQTGTELTYAEAFVAEMII